MKRYIFTEILSLRGETMANKQPSSREANIRSYFTEVNKFTQTAEYDKAIKSLNKSKLLIMLQFPGTHANFPFSPPVLNLDPEDTTAGHCKVVCLVQLSKFQEALQVVEKYKLGKLLVFETAYCQYRLNDPIKAYNTIKNSFDSVSMMSAQLKELFAQVLYRMERYEQCFDVYRDIIKNTDDDYEEERTTNLSAVVANLSIEGSVIIIFFCICGDL